MRDFSFSVISSISGDVFLIHSCIFVGREPFNISCKGDVEYDVHEPHDEFVDSATDGMQEKSIGEKLCRTSVAVYLCILRMI